MFQKLKFDDKTIIFSYILVETLKILNCLFYIKILFKSSKRYIRLYKIYYINLYYFN